MQQGNMRLYGCGGAGINIASFFERAAGEFEPGHAHTHLSYVDTSGSNLSSAFKNEHVFLLDGVDGSGKVRRENHVEIQKNIKALLQEHTPQDLNVVIFSASGGSGSVFGPLIIRELLERKATVVGLVIGSDESEITAENTIKTLKSLDAISEQTGMPVVICYEHNEPSIKRSAIDTAVRSVIGSLAVLASRQNAELDTKDIANWAQYHQSTQYKPGLALLDVYNNNEEAEKVVHPIAVASLYRTPDDLPVTLTPGYSCVGYPRNSLESFNALHFVITNGGVPVINKRLQTRLTALEQDRRSRVEHDRLLSTNDVTTAGGLVL